MSLEINDKFKLWEDIAAGSAIKRKYGKYGYEIEDDATWREIAKDISRGLAVLIPVLHPDVVIVGGSIGSHFEHYAKYVKDNLIKQLDPIFTDFKLVQAKHPQEAVIYGCYYQAVHHLN
jgi:predicted NBD/HSP70 family sugar kinase